MPSKKLTLPDQGIDNLIREIRGQKVILDSDLARVYGVPHSASTKRLNATETDSHRTSCSNSPLRSIGL